MLALRFSGNRTQAEIANELGVSQMHVSRLLSAALSWLRAAMLNDEAPPWHGADPLPPSLGVTVEPRIGGAVVTVRGEIDRDNAPRLRTALYTATEDVTVVDLTGVALIDAAGCATLADAVRNAAIGGRRVVLTGARPLVAHALKVTGVPMSCLQPA
jgi:RNA polymerase sigma-B factor